MMWFVVANGEVKARTRMAPETAQVGEPRRHMAALMVLVTIGAYYCTMSASVPLIKAREGQIQILQTKKLPLTIISTLRVHFQCISTWIEHFISI